MPHTLRAVDRDSEVLSALKVLSGFDTDLTHECTRAINRLRSLLLQIFPALERAFPGTVLTRSLVLELLIKYAGPTGLRAAGRGNVLRWARNHSRKDPAALIDAVFAALGEQTVTVDRDRSRGTGHPARRRPDQGTQTPAGHRGRRSRKTPGRLPSFQGLDVHAGSRHQDRRDHTPDHRRRGAASALRRTPRRLRRHRPGHTALRHLHPRRIPCPLRQQRTQERTVPIRMDSLLPRPAYPRPTTSGNAPKGRNTTPPSSASPGAAATSSTPCSKTEPSTRKKLPKPLDQKHRDTPPRNPGHHSTPAATARASGENPHQLERALGSSHTGPRTRPGAPAPAAWTAVERAPTARAIPGNPHLVRERPLWAQFAAKPPKFR